MCVHVCERERSKRLDEQQQTPASAYEKGFFHLKSFFLSTAKVKSHITEIKPINTNTSIERLSLSRFEKAGSARGIPVFTHRQMLLLFLFTYGNWLYLTLLYVSSSVLFLWR